jgi:hypothetical protein
MYNKKVDYVTPLYTKPAYQANEYKQIRDLSRQIKVIQEQTAAIKDGRLNRVNTLEYDPKAQSYQVKRKLDIL